MNEITKKEYDEIKNKREKWNKTKKRSDGSGIVEFKRKNWLLFNKRGELVELSENEAEKEKFDEWEEVEILEEGREGKRELIVLDGYLLG